MYRGRIVSGFRFASVPRQAGTGGMTKGREAAHRGMGRGG
jgi:hypothetical protein